MSTPANEALAAPDLQFDSAERTDGAAPGQVSCTACKSPIATHYHTLNGAVVCEACRRAFEALRAAGHGRLPLAILFGAAAALLGAVIYVGVAVITNLEVGLIAILVGWMVGKAVHKGSGGKGGPVYQAIAVGLTYLSILSLYVLGAIGEGSAGGFFSLLFLPFTQGAGNVIGLVILGIGLFQAWKMNEEPVVTVLGPYQVKAGGAPGEGVPAGV